MSADGAAWCAAQMLSLTDHVIWSTIRARQMNTWLALKAADFKLQTTADTN